MTLSRNILSVSNGAALAMIEISRFEELDELAPRVSGGSFEGSRSFYVSVFHSAYLLTSEDDSLCEIAP